VVPPPPLPAVFSESGAAPAAPADPRWWRAFGDTALDELVESALRDNPGIAALAERFRRAAAFARRAASPLGPSLDLSAGVGAAASERSALGRREVDVEERLAFGAAASSEACATAGDWQAARIALAASVATTWYRLVAEVRIGRILEEQTRTNETLLDLVEGRFEQGKVGAADVLRQQQLVEATRGDQVLTLSRAAVLEHALATLLGRAAPAALPAAAESFPDLPPLPATGVPGEVLRRRPDVAAAWGRVWAADRELAAALAHRYPRLTLEADALLGGAGLGLLFRDWLLGIAADLTAPILDGGERRARVEETRALRRERLHEYGEALLVAVQEVEDALVRERRAREFMESLDRQLDLAHRVVRTLLDRYGQGAADYLDVLAALTAEQGLARRAVEAEREIVEHRVALCRALAGEWAGGAAR
jgi:outer membrane protein TolC